MNESNSNSNSNTDNWLYTFYLEQLESLRRKSNEKLIKKFNREVGNNGWTGTRGAYLSALRDALEERNLELDETVFGKGFTSYRHKVKLVGNKVIAVEPK